MASPLNQMRIITFAIFLALPLFPLSSAYAGTPLVTLWGTFTNTAFLPDGMIRYSREFEVTVSRTNCVCLVTNPATGSRWHAIFTEGRCAVRFQGPITNAAGEISYPITGRIDSRPAPRPDGTLEHLWLAFGSYPYFSTRADTAARPIWPEPEVTDEQQAQMGTRAFYKALPGAPFPLEVSYVCDGCDYFIGQTEGLLQRVPLKAPLDAGYTNVIGRTTAYTNIQGLLVPLRFESHRYAPKRQGPDARAALRVLRDTTITVNRITTTP